MRERESNASVQKMIKMIHKYWINICIHTTIGGRYSIFFATYIFSFFITLLQFAGGEGMRG